MDELIRQQGSCRGVGDSKFCLLCKNQFDSKSNICDEDGSNLLRCDANKKAELVPAESNVWRRAARYLAAQRHYGACPDS